MKKFLTFSLAAAMTLGFAACSSQDLPQPVQVQDDHDGSYVQLQFSFPDVTSRAGEDDATDAAADAKYTETESSGKYVQGEAYEYNIKNAYLYFFKVNDDGTTVPVEITFTENGSEVTKLYYPIGVYKTGSNESTSEADNPTAAAASSTDSSTASAGKAVAWKTVTFSLPSGIKEGNTYHVYALINRPVDATITSEKDLLDSQLVFDPTSTDEVLNCGLVRKSGSDNKTRVTNIDIPMSARSYDGTVYEVFKPERKYTKAEPAELKFEVERSLARIAFNMNETLVPVYESVTTTAGSTTINKTNQVAVLDLFAYRVVNKQKEFYTYRHVGSLTAGESAITPTFDWTDNTAITNPAPICVGPSTSANPYIIDPNTKLKPATGATYNNFLNLLSDTKKLDYSVKEYDGLKEDSQFTKLEAAEGEDNNIQPVSIEYVSENTMYKAAQRKGQTTGIIFAAKINPVKIDGEDYSTRTGGMKTWTYSDDKAGLYYYDGWFYTTLDKLMEKTKLEGVTNLNLATFGIRYFHHGIAYFEYYIRHVNNYDYTTMGEMEFGTVRNNSYELTVEAAAITGAYTKLPGDDPKEPDPDDPDTWDPEGSPDPTDDDETVKIYMEVNVKVRPWVVRTNDIVIL